MFSPVSEVRTLWPAVTLLVLLLSCNGVPDSNWSGAQDDFSSDMPRPYCEQLSTCSIVPADFDQRSCQTELTAYISEMPCYSSALAADCMERLNADSSNGNACGDFWTYPEDGSCQWAVWDAEPCSYR